MTLGKRSIPQLATFSGRVPAGNIPTPMLRWGAIAALSVLAMLATLHVWSNVFRVPLEFPTPSLFAPPRGGPAPLWMGAGEKSKAGWMAWYVPMLTTAFFASVVLARLTRQRHRWSVLSMAVAGCVAVLTGVTIAFWAEHNGYMWYFRPEMTLGILLSVQGRLLAESSWEAMFLLSGQWPLLVMGSVVGAGCAVLARVPLRRPRGGALAQGTVLGHLDEQTELKARIISAVILLIVSQMGKHHNHPLYMLAAGSCIAIVWFAVAFPRVEFNFKRLVLGSFTAAIVASPISTWLLYQRNSLFATFKNNPFMSEVIFAEALRNFMMVFIVYFIGLTLIFMLFAKVTVWLCQRRSSA